MRAYERPALEKVGGFDAKTNGWGSGDFETFGERA